MKINGKNILLKNIKAIILIGVLILFQMFTYFVTKFFQTEWNLITSKIDDKIPYISIFVYFYIIWYVMLLIIPLILYEKDRTNFKRYVLTYVIAIVLAGIVFIVYPTEIIRPEIKCNSLSNCLVKFLYYMDTPAVNCLPSIHCLLAFLYIFSTINSNKITKKTRYITLILSSFIVLSTLFIKQHVIYDVALSFTIILLVWPVSKIFVNKLEYKEKCNK